MHARTPEGRAEAWVSGMQSLVHTCDVEMKRCTAATCPMPKGLAREYAATFASKAALFKRTKNTIEKVLSGKLETDLGRVMMDAENAVAALKEEASRFRSLLKSYEKAAKKV